MRHAERRAPPVLRGTHESTAFERHEDVDTDEGLRELDAQGFTERNVLERRVLRLVQLAESGGDELRQALRYADLPSQSPYGAVALQRAGALSGVDELAQQEGVAGADPRELGACGAVDVLTQDAVDEQLGVFGAEQLEIETTGQSVRPQGQDRVGQPFGRSRGDQHRHRTARREPMDQRGRRVVEQVRVVDCDEQSALTGSRDQLVGRRDDRAGPAGPGFCGRQQVAERTERDRGLGSSRECHHRQPSVGLAARDDFGHEPALAHARFTGEHEACGRFRGGAVEDGRELVVASDERPLTEHRTDGTGVPE